MSTVHERDDVYSHDHKRTYESQFMEKDKKFQEDMTVHERDDISSHDQKPDVHIHDKKPDIHIHDQKPTYEGHFMG